MVEVTGHAEGCVVAVRGQPGARRNEVAGERNGRLKVAVQAPADEGRANRAILEVLAATLGLKKSQVELMAGATSRDKKVLVRGVAVEEMRRLLREKCGVG